MMLVILEILLLFYNYEKSTNAGVSIESYIYYAFGLHF